MITMTKGGLRQRYYGLGYLSTRYVQGPVATIVGLVTSYTTSRQPTCVTTGRNLLEASDRVRELGATTTGQSG